MLNGKLAMVAPSPRGGPGETVDKEKRNIRSFRVPHFQRDDAVMADEVQGVRAFGTGNQLEAVQTKIDARLARHARDLRHHAGAPAGRRHQGHRGRQERGRR
jgi:hypothetical protein